MFKVVPVVIPNIDLRQFITLLSADAVNAVDVKLKGPTEKFSALADDLLYKGFGERHLHYTFYVELPVFWTTIMDSFPQSQMFRRTTITEGMMVHGLISGPLDVWRNLMLWILNDENGKSLRDFAKIIMKTLPFQNDNELRMLR